MGWHGVHRCSSHLSNYKLTNNSVLNIRKSTSAHGEEPKIMFRLIWRVRFLTFESLWLAKSPNTAFSISTCYEVPRPHLRTILTMISQSCATKTARRPFRPAEPWSFATVTASVIGNVSGSSPDPLIFIFSSKFAFETLRNVFLLNHHPQPAQQFVLLHTFEQWSGSKHDLNSSVPSNHAALRRLEYNGKRAMEGKKMKISITPTVTISKNHHNYGWKFVLCPIYSCSRSRRNVISSSVYNLFGIFHHRHSLSMEAFFLHCTMLHIALQSDIQARSC